MSKGGYKVATFENKVEGIMSKAEKLREELHAIYSEIKDAVTA